MAHAGETKAARPVGVDRMPTGDEAFVAGRRGAHAFAFALAMIWGIFVATYSSIFICSPMLIYLGVRADTLDKPQETEPQVIAPKAKAKA